MADYEQLRTSFEEDRRATDGTITTLEHLISNPTDAATVTNAVQALTQLQPRYSSPPKLEVIERYTDAGEFTAQVNERVSALLKILTGGISGASTTLQNIRDLQKNLETYARITNAVGAKAPDITATKNDVTVLYTELESLANQLKIQRKGIEVEAPNYGNAMEDLKHAKQLLDSGERLSKAIDRLNSAANYLTTLGETDIPREMGRYAKADLEAIESEALSHAIRLNPYLDAMSDIYTKALKKLRREGQYGGTAKVAPIPAPSPEPPIITPPTGEGTTVPLPEPEGGGGDEEAAKGSPSFHSSFAPSTRF